MACTASHSHEIFATPVDKTHDVFPGVKALEQLAQEVCYAEFDTFVGISPFDSELNVTWIVPSLSTWNDKKDRTILCVLTRRDLGRMTTSAKDTGV